MYRPHAFLPSHRRAAAARRSERGDARLGHDHPLVGQASDADVAVMLELADRAPVELREPVRGLLWITGWLRPLTDLAARTRAAA